MEEMDLWFSGRGRNGTLSASHRTDLLERIFDWATDYAGKRTFWLCGGKAGTGKSTILRTIARRSLTAAFDCAPASR